MVAMAPHSRCRRMQQLANMPRYKIMSLNLKNTIIITLNSTILVTMRGLCAWWSTDTTQTQMVSKLNALSFGPAASSIGDMPGSILMALAGVPAVELFNLVWYWWRTSVLRACKPAGSTKTRVCTKISSVIQLLFRGNAVEVTPPNHTSNKTEGGNLNNCDLI